ncbi:MAG: hypothetical protein LBJ92_00040 [Holosporales bacterium]|jgi:hypothetical protein|nr:hypothetical protein [Holosporales bacterium]
MIIRFWKLFMIVVSWLWIGGGQDVFGMELASLLNHSETDWNDLYLSARIEASCGEGCTNWPKVSYCGHNYDLPLYSQSVEVPVSNISHFVVSGWNKGHLVMPDPFNPFPHPHISQLELTVYNSRSGHIFAVYSLNFVDNPTQEMIVNIPGSSFRIEMTATHFGGRIELMLFTLRLLYPEITTLPSS